jgi:hypothetical protein
MIVLSFCGKSPLQILSHSAQPRSAADCKIRKAKHGSLKLNETRGGKRTFVTVLIPLFPFSLTAHRRAFFSLSHRQVDGPIRRGSIRRVFRQLPILVTLLRAWR